MQIRAGKSKLPPARQRNLLAAKPEITINRLLVFKTLRQNAGIPLTTIATGYSRTSRKSVGSFNFSREWVGHQGRQWFDARRSAFHLRAPSPQQMGLFPIIDGNRSQALRAFPLERWLTAEVARVGCGDFHCSSLVDTYQRPVRSPP